MSAKTVTLSPKVAAVVIQGAHDDGRSLNNFVNTKLAEYFGLPPDAALGFKREAKEAKPKRVRAKTDYSSGIPGRLNTTGRSQKKSKV